MSRRRSANGARRRGERGAALLIVLWASVVLAGLAAAIGGTVRADVTVTRNLLREAETRYAAQAGVMHGLMLLMDANTGGDDPLLAGRTEIDFHGVTVQLAFRDECGKVDLNTAWGDLVRNLVELHAARAGAPSPAAAILDWRDPNSVPVAGGAEDADYRALGRSHGARDGPFDTVAELRQIDGMNEPLMRAIAPDVTVDCLNAGIDPMVASPDVLAALPGVGREAREDFVAARAAYVAGGARGPEPQLAGGGRYVAASPGLAVEIVASVPSEAGATSWRAVAWLTGDGARPFLLRTWERVRGTAPLTR